MPAVTRSLISEDSSSAMAPIKVNIARPMGLSVSTWSWTLTKRMPRWSNSSSAASRWRVLRAKRSNFQTRTQSTSRFRAAAIKALSPGRPSLRPETATSR